VTEAARQYGSARVIRTRLNVFVEREHARRLTEHASLKGISKSSIVAAALASFLSPDAADQRGAIARRLDRLARQFERLERDQNILIETVALYVRYFLSISTPVPEEQQEAARALGRARFEKFIEQLAGHLRRGRSLVADVHQERIPDDDGAQERTPDEPKTGPQQEHQ
jgi:hypothetical protein